MVLTVAIGCRGSNAHVGFDLTVVNQSSDGAALEWHDDAPFAQTSSEPIAACRFTARGFEIGRIFTISVRSSSDQVTFVIEPPEPSPGVLPSRTVLVHPDGSIDADAPPVALPSSTDESVC